MSKHGLALAVIAFFAPGPGIAADIACVSTGGMNRCPLPGADTRRVKVKQVLEGKCVREQGWWADSDGVVVDKGCNAVFSYGASSRSAKSSSASPGTDSNASAYYDDGCKAGARDKKARLSMAHERHAGAYDTANEGPFQAGYDKCWMKTKR